MRKTRIGRTGRRSKLSRDWEKLAGVVLGALAVIAALTIIIVTIMVGSNGRDPMTLCPDSGPRKLTVIVVDMTDRVGTTSREDILGRLEDLVLGSRSEEMMLVYGTSWSPSHTNSPRIMVCNPGDPDQANPLISSPERIRKELEERFLKPLNILFRELVDTHEADSSPLMETIQLISVTQFSRQRYAEVPKQLILVSDLMQNSENLSLYRDIPNFVDFAQTAGGEALQANLTNVVVNILFVPRGAHMRLNITNQLIGFWNLWIGAQGGILNRVSKVSGLN